MRFWNQWIQCGALDGLAALVVGQLVGIEDRGEVLDQFAARGPCPVFSCNQFGHEKPSFAVGQGAQAHITGNELHWEIDEFKAN
jgi:muramoyltetrapeptide carboxypeptidase LdcA involved in peptidoglycan recycling